MCRPGVGDLSNLDRDDPAGISGMDIGKEKHRSKRVGLKDLSAIGAAIAAKYLLA
jgi:hypothetical protein